MKLVLLAGTAFLGLVVSGSPVRAVPFDFTYTGSLVTFTVPTTDNYQILAFGAQGGASIGTGGRGAKIGSDFSLTAGESLQIAVGGAGTPGEAGGGGGGTFVIGFGNTPLIIAGGGGGGGGSVIGGVPHPGQGGLIGPDGGPGGLSGGDGGTGGNGGAAGGFVGGGGGGGFFSAGSSGDAGGGGGAFPGLAGGAGASSGGFGGGGGGGPAIRTRGAAGGGGGYSGGGGGSNGAMGDFGAGGGGGSFDAGTDQILLADFQTGNGEVVITEIAAAVPEPATIALLGAGLISLAAVRRRKPPVG